MALAVLIPNVLMLVLIYVVTLHILDRHISCDDSYRNSYFDTINDFFNKK